MNSYSPESPCCSRLWRSNGDGPPLRRGASAGASLHRPLPPVPPDAADAGRGVRALRHPYPAHEAHLELHQGAQTAGFQGQALLLPGLQANAAIRPWQEEDCPPGKVYHALSQTNELKDD